ncbi:MAG TPA: methylated-DNA--[protein]-cysteine S-methyltransferase [Solirubrobacterales bacterium]|nr:methylated-DNA--[protein]-cysteine S-methyltransferase [Solirubrobacterales bacterium]
MTRAHTKDIARVLGTGIEDAAADAAQRLVRRAESERLVKVAYAGYDSPLGPGYVAATARGVVGVALPGRSEDAFLTELAEGVSPRVLEAPGRLDEARRELDQYFAGTRTRFELPLDWSLVPPGFYGRVLRQTAKLPYGATSTYGEVAARAGNARAFRAAGTALATNPIPLVVPCHRVLRAGGVLGNYGGGPEMKRFLLEHEGAIAGA